MQMKKKIIFSALFVICVCVVGIVWFSMQKETLYDVTIDSNDLFVTLTLEKISRHESTSKIYPDRCIWFDTKNRSELFDAIKTMDCFAYSLTDGKKTKEESDQYVLIKDGVYFYLSGEWDNVNEYYAVCLSRGVLTYEKDDDNVEKYISGDFPFPKICKTCSLGLNLESLESDTYFCPWNHTIGLNSFEDLTAFYSGSNSSYVKVDETNKIIYIRPKEESRKLPDFVLEGDWLDYIGKMTVSDEGITISFSDEYAKEAAAFTQ